MDAQHFDDLSRALSTGESRRRLLAFFVALPLLGGLRALSDPEDADGKGRRKRRKKAHKHGRGRRRQGRGKKPCKPQPVAETCAGKCGSVRNNCKKTVDCGSCDCNPICAECFTCEGSAGAPGTCVPTADGTACGSGEVCCFGACQACCDKAQCSNPEPICVNGTCAACSDSDQCADEEVCCNGSCFTGICCTDADCGTTGDDCVDLECRCGSGAACDADSEACCSGTCLDILADPANCGACGNACGGETPDCWGGECVCGDVCASGCQFTTVQAAIDAASGGDTIRICAGTYGRSNGGSVALITNKSVTLAGAGQGESGTILDGGASENNSPVVYIIDAGTTVELRDLRVTGAQSTTVFGGGVSAARSGLTLLRTTVTDNSASVGGGIHFQGPGKTLTITDSTISHNSASLRGGGLAIEWGTANLNSTTVTQNSTLGNGGGIFNQVLAYEMNITDSTISRNSSTGPGGGIENKANVTLTLNTTLVTLNTAPAAAGVRNAGSLIVNPGSNITDNTVGNCVNFETGSGCP